MRTSESAPAPQAVPTASAPPAAVRVVSTDSPPPPQMIVPTVRYVGFEKDTFAQAYSWACGEMARKYPGSVPDLTHLGGMIDQFLKAR